MASFYLEMKFSVMIEMDFLQLLLLLFFLMACYSLITLISASLPFAPLKGKKISLIEG